MPRFVPRERKHKVLARAKKKQSDEVNQLPQDDPNALEIVHQQQQKLRSDRPEYEQLGANGKVSGKKKKRLDKYIVRILVLYHASHPKCFHMYRQRS